MVASPPLMKKSQLAESAAVADELVDIRVSHRRSGTLEREIRFVSAECFLHCAAERFDSLVVHEVDGIVCSHPLREIQPLLIAVYCHNIFNPHGTEDRDTDQSDRSAALNHNPAVEPQDAGCLRPLNRVDQYGAGFDQDHGTSDPDR